MRRQREDNEFSPTLKAYWVISSLVLMKELRQNRAVVDMKKVAVRHIRLGPRDYFVGEGCYVTAIT